MFFWNVHNYEVYNYKGMLLLKTLHSRQKILFENTLCYWYIKKRFLLILLVVNKNRKKLEKTFEVEVFIKVVCCYCKKKNSFWKYKRFNFYDIIIRWRSTGHFVSCLVWLARTRERDENESRTSWVVTLII